MKTNELKKGCRVRLANGWEAILEDNCKGNIRMATVFGYCTEMGSVYAHDIVGALVNDVWFVIIHTEAQLRCKESIQKIFG